ncbi:hypothetical protein ACLBKS_01165 [Hylemonella sp. W303a]|uniref:hypothetical protein n=1 Tax=Hylemonella sp. W303a TaxID=3389873 RepID=UPI00396B1832
MSFTVALLLLALGVLIGYQLPGRVAALKALVRRLRYRPQRLRAWTPAPMPTQPRTRATRAPAPRRHG